MPSIRQSWLTKKNTATTKIKPDLTVLLDLSIHRKNRRQGNKVNITVEMQSSTSGKSFPGNLQDKQPSAFPIKLLEETL